ncbi:MAG: Crp/Fnr family transcriptional regulator [Lachnospiraceae bacterium]|nr:Crp/Fnr family transcriptional regulator [Lachnospiraceae bacterium]
MSELRDFFPVWNKLNKNQQEKLETTAVFKTYHEDEVVHNGTECSGFLIVKSGQLRAHISSEEGREITVYRLFERDTCMFSGSCMMSSLQFDITIEAEKKSEIWLIPPKVFRSLMDESTAVANFMNEIMATRLSDIMWLIEQVMWKSFDKRLAAFLVEESSIEEKSQLKITHERIANHLGTAREVVTRMLKYFQNEGMVKLTRGTIEITDLKALEVLGE